MGEQRRYHRFVIEGEFEILDMTQVRAANFDWQRSEDGGIEMAERDHPDSQEALRALTSAMSTAASSAAASIGVKWLSMSSFVRPIEGGVYAPFELPEMPVSDES